MNTVTKQQQNIAIGERQRVFHNRKAMSYNDVNPHGHIFNQQQLKQQQTHRSSFQDPYSPTQLSNDYGHHGKKPSLAGFDPFSSTAAYTTSSPQPVYNQAVDSIWCNGRDSSPSVGKARVNNDRQPITPPSTGRPIATKHKRTDKAPVITNYERFDNEKAKNSSPMAKKVNKFLRKAVLVKSLSLGQHIPNSKMTKDKRSSSPIEAVAASASGTAAATKTTIFSRLSAET